MKHMIGKFPGVADRPATAATPAQMAALGAAVDATPDVDPVLVAVLRETIERGGYRVDPRHVAHKMILLDGI